MLTNVITHCDIWHMFLLVVVLISQKKECIEGTNKIKIRKAIYHWDLFPKKKPQVGKWIKQLNTLLN